MSRRNDPQIKDVHIRASNIFALNVEVQKLNRLGLKVSVLDHRLNEMCIPYRVDRYIAYDKNTYTRYYIHNLTDHDFPQLRQLV